MSKEKQIEEMQTVINGALFADFRNGHSVCIKTISEYLYTAGYRKQKEGEWIEHIEKPSWLEDDVEVYYNCSACGTSHWSITPPYCPNCGAKMKGGETDAD